MGHKEVPVTHLRKMMLEELQRRHYSEGTTRYYIRHVERFARYFHRPPDRLGPQHIREYQAQLFSKQKLSPGAVTNHLCALRFFYIQTLKRRFPARSYPSINALDSPSNSAAMSAVYWHCLVAVPIRFVCRQGSHQ